jgi:hypothetical protein
VVNTTGVATPRGEYSGKSIVNTNKSMNVLFYSKGFQANPPGPEVVTRGKKPGKNLGNCPIK